MWAEARGRALKPIPRSVASQSAATGSALRTCSPVGDLDADPTVEGTNASNYEPRVEGINGGGGVERVATSAARTEAVSEEGHFEAAPLTADDRRALLRFMLLMRTTEERALSLYQQGKVPGSFYDGRGQEAVDVAVDR
jgi:hypothetical protein